MEEEYTSTGPNSLQRAERKTRALARVYRNKRDNRIPLGGEVKKESKISTGTIWFMGFVVLIYEGVNALLNIFIPGIGPFLSGIVADLHFYMWFKMKGVNFTKNPSRALGWIGMLFFNEAEGIDEVSLPLGVAFTIISVRLEEKLENSSVFGGLAKKAISVGKKVNKL